MPRYLVSFDGYILIDAKDDDEAFEHGHKLFGSLIERSGFDMDVTITDVSLD